MFSTKNKTVDGVLAVFTKALTDLSEVAVAQNKAVEDSEVAIKALQDRVVIFKTEALRAESVKLKLQELLGA